ncbi:hypothetical protein T4D_3709 [Trichinella pseudospiralis]|uniref:Uncharacterized protein n=1 Tax=Trichinella pseudospiralis TaxID=6337 RepID=A0A0V1G404_TRIPS|nr:hypothetical protein T4D_3709 [Trichinella pseudospiralis]
MLIFGLYGLEDVDNILMFVVQLIGYLFNHSYFLDQLIPSSLIFDRLDQHRSFVLEKDIKEIVSHLFAASRRQWALDAKFTKILNIVSYSIVPPKWWPAAVAAAPVDDNCPCEQYECAGSNSLLKKRSVTQTPQSNERAETKAGKNQ